MADGISNVDQTILKLAENYQRTLMKSRELNEERATIRDNVEKLGIDPLAFQSGLRMARDMTNGERSDYTSSLERVLGVLDGKESDLFGADEIEKRNKRAERRAEKDAKAGTPREAQDDKSDANPRSDPDAGGAKPQVEDDDGDDGDDLPDPDEPPAETIKEASKRSDEAVKQTVAAAEQREGDKVLNDMAPVSQSAQAARKRRQAGLH